MGTTSAQSPAHLPPPPPFSCPPRPNDPEVVRNIEVLAAFVVKHGAQFEQMAQTKKAEDPKFTFLVGGSPGTEAAVGHEFYEWKKKCLQQQIFAQDGSDDVQMKIWKHIHDVEAPKSPLKSEKDMMDPKPPLSAGVHMNKDDLTAGSALPERTQQDDPNKRPGQLVHGARGVKELETGVDELEAREKLSKEARGLKLLRSALVEYVKEVLKPSWKEGHMSKDAYKVIVKKVVDKVSGTLQSHQVPKSQENVDQYMEQSQAKIAKLVQGYVEKFRKA